MRPDGGGREGGVAGGGCGAGGRWRRWWEGWGGGRPSRRAGHATTRIFFRRKFEWKISLAVDITDRVKKRRDWRRAVKDLFVRIVNDRHAVCVFG